MIAVGAVVLFLVAGDRLVLGPWLDHGAKLTKQIRGLENGIKGQRKILARRNIIQSEARVYGSFLQKARTPEIEMASFLKEIEDLARQSGVSLQEVRPLPSSAGDLFREFSLDVNFAAKLTDWLTFVHAVESSASLFTIERAQVGIEEEGKETLKGQMRISRRVLTEGESA